MQAVDILPEKPYVYKGLTVQGVSPTRLTPLPNENITVPDEVGRAIVARNLARRFTESRIAIAMVGLGVQPAALTVSGVVRALITRAELARTVADIKNRTSTPKPERLSSSGGFYLVDEEVDMTPAEGEVEL